MISLKAFALVVGFVGSSLVGRAGPVCDFEGRCYSDAPQQPYHMDLAHPDVETPPPAPQYPCSYRRTPTSGREHRRAAQRQRTRLSSVSDAIRAEHRAADRRALPRSRRTKSALIRERARAAEEQR